MRAATRIVSLCAALATAGAAPLAAQQSAAEQEARAQIGVSVQPWQIIRPPQSSLVLARDGSLIGEIGTQWRTNVSLSSLPAYVPAAFVAVEDQRFYQHDGVDVVGIAAAIKDHLLGEGRGASTITQQLVGNMHPTIIDRSDVSISRKLREQSAAREMERHYSKQQILEAYLNQVHFGRNWYGIEAAARHYFGKRAAELSIAEAATLAGVINGPSLYDPIRHPERTKRRRDLVLRLMADQGYITPAQLREARATPLQVAPRQGMSAPAMYFVDAVRVLAEANGIPVRDGGYRIRTTLDPALQRAAQDALVRGIAGIETTPGYRHYTPQTAPRGSTDLLQGAVVAMDPATGDVRALVGGRDHATAPFNRATNARRQPGSTFKPFVYARALVDSLPPTAIVPDTALVVAYDRQVYAPGNADGEFRGLLTMREALAQSRNPAAVALWQRLGADSVIAIARRAGIVSPIAPFPSSAIGASVVRPLELVAAYTAFANLGAAVEPRMILAVEDPVGRTVFGEPVRRLPPALDSAAAYVTVQMMRDVVDRGTGWSVRRFVPESVPVAGKSGTTDDNTDVWFVGMTPSLVAGVWLGFDRPKTISPGAGGGGLAAPIFGQMLANGGALDATGWPMPANVVVAELDRETRTLAEPWTPAERVYREVFVAGTEPGALRVDARRLFLTYGPLPGM